MPDATDLSQDPVRTVTVTPTRSNRRLAKLIVALVLASLVAWFIATIWGVVRTPLVPHSSPLVVNDVSQLNPVRVDQVISPTTTNEIADAVRVLALKQRLDPTNKFRSKLLDKYLHPR